MTPMALANPGFRETGKFKAHTLPASIRSANGGNGRPYLPSTLSSGSDYAMRLNLAAQINLVNGALPRMSVGGRIVFVTSHLAHFYGTGSSSPLAFQGGTPI